MTDSTFYDSNWTVLNKIRYLEKWFKENAIDLSTLEFTTNQDGVNISVSISGTNFKGEQVTLENAIAYQTVQGEMGLPLFAVNSSVITAGFEVNQELVIPIGAITPSNFTVGCNVIVGSSGTGTDYIPQIAFGNITKIEGTDVTIKIIHVTDIPTGGGGGTSEENLISGAVYIPNATESSDRIKVLNNRLPFKIGNSYRVEVSVDGVVTSGIATALDGSEAYGENVITFGVSDLNGYASVIFLNGLSADFETQQIILGDYCTIMGQGEYTELYIRGIYDEGVILYQHSGVLHIDANASDDEINRLSGVIPFSFISAYNQQYNNNSILCAMADTNQGYRRGEGDTTQYTIIKNGVMLLPGEPGIDNAVGFSILAWNGVDAESNLNVNTNVVGNDTSTNSPVCKVFATTRNGANISRSAYNITRQDKLLPVDVAF